MRYNIFKQPGFYALLALVVFSTSCEKELAKPTIDPKPLAYVAVHNFALLAGTTSQVFVENSRLALGGSNVALAVGGSLLGNYIGVNPGQVTVGLRTATGTSNYASRTVTVAATSNTSFFAYDTLTTGGAAKLLVLTNDMRAQDTATSGIRLLHLSPNAGPVNVVLTRTLNQFGLAATGTINLSNVPYIGSAATPNEAALSVFNKIPAGTYRVDVLSGTTSLLPPPPATLPVITLRETKNYSIVARGFAPPRTAIPSGQALGISLLLHNP